MTMDCILEKKIKFSSKKENTLYSWCLNEIGNKEKDHNKDLIPYAFSTYFEASTLRITKRVGAQLKHSKNEMIRESDNSVVISADLKPSFRPNADYRDTSYFMFGTDRRIDSISLTIENLGNDTDIEVCNLWGSPSYKGEIDFREFIEADHLSASIFVKNSQFESFVRMIESKSVESILLILRQVDGFYSPWSPSISTSSIKVLTEYHEIEGQIDLDRPLPKVGNVGEFSLTFSSSLDLNQKINIDTTDEDEILIEQSTNKIESDNSKYFAIADNLKKPLWWILFVLILILLNQ
jgi:hypothetical protein